MNRAERKIITDNKDQILEDLRHVFRRHGIDGVGMNVALFKTDCPGGYWQEYTIYDKRKKKYVTKLRYVCP